MPLDGHVSNDMLLDMHFNLDGLIAWLEKQPKDTTYNWFNYEDCLLMRYMQSHGWDGNFLDLVSSPNYNVVCSPAVRHPFTYKKALDRAVRLRDSRGT